MNTPTISTRQTGDMLAILNWSSGDLMVFESDDGKYVRDNLSYFMESTSSDDREIKSLLDGDGSLVPNSRKLRGSLLQMGATFGIPVVVNMEINRRCNERCDICYIGLGELNKKERSAFEEMSLEDFDAMLDDFVALGVFLLVFTGGEAFLTKQLHDFIKIAASKGFVSEIFSNLQYVPSWIFQSDSVELMIGRIQTTIYSGDACKHDSRTSVKGSFHRTLHNMQKLQDKGYYVEVASPLTYDSFESRKVTKKLFDEIGIKQDFSWPIVNEYYTQYQGQSRLNISASQMKRFLAENPDFLLEIDFSHNDDHICGAGRAMFAIDAKGAIYPCSQYPKELGNIRNDRVSDVFRSTGMAEIGDVRRRAVNVDKAYNFCMGNNYSETGDPLVQPVFIRTVAEKAQPFERR